MLLGLMLLSLPEVWSIVACLWATEQGCNQNSLAKRFSSHISIAWRNAIGSWRQIWVSWFAQHVLDRWDGSFRLSVRLWVGKAACIMLKVKVLGKRWVRVCWKIRPIVGEANEQDAVSSEDVLKHIYHLFYRLWVKLYQLNVVWKIIYNHNILLAIDFKVVNNNFLPKQF